MQGFSAWFCPFCSVFIVFGDKKLQEHYSFHLVPKNLLICQRFCPKYSKFSLEYFSHIVHLTFVNGYVFHVNARKSCAVHTQLVCNAYASSIQFIRICMQFMHSCAILTHFMRISYPIILLKSSIMIDTILWRLFLAAP